MNLRALLLTLCALWLAGCGSSQEQQILNNPAVEAALVSLRVIGPTQLAPGQTAQYLLSGTFDDGSTQDLSKLATWSSSQTDIATIDATGLGTAFSGGSTTITGTVRGRSATLTLTVTSTTLTSLVVTPANTTLAVAGTLNYQAQGSFSDGSSRDLTNEVVWSSSSTSVATISPLGQARGLVEGSTTITASLGAVSGSTGLQVTPAPLVSLSIEPADARIGVGETLRYKATGVFTDGRTADLTGQVVWAVSNTTVARIASQGGAAAGLFPGFVTVTAALGGVSASANLEVFGLPAPIIPPPPPVASGRLHVSANNGDSIRTFANAFAAVGAVTASSSIDDSPSNFLGITMDVGRNILYAADFAGGRVLSYNSPGASPTARNTVTGFINTVDVAVSSGTPSRLFVLNQVTETGQLIVIDGADSATGALGGLTSRSHGNISFEGSTCDPRGVSYDQTNDRVYISVFGSGTGGIVVVDNISTRAAGNLTGAGVRVFRTSVGSDFPLRDPQGLMIEPASRRLYVADGEGRLIVFANADTASGETEPAAVVTTSLKWAPRDAFIDAARDQVYVSDNSGFVHVFNTASTLAGVDDMTARDPDRTLSGMDLADARALFLDTTR